MNVLENVKKRKKNNFLNFKLLRRLILICNKLYEFFLKGKSKTIISKLNKLSYKTKVMKNKWL